MPIDTSKLRRRLPPPPGDGNPVVEIQPASAPSHAPPTPMQGGVPTRLDGRSLRRTGRTEQVNVKMRPETREALLRLAQERGLGVSELVEGLIEREANTRR